MGNRHAPMKGIEIQETENLVKQVPSIKKMPIISKGMISFDRLKEFIEGTIKISMKSPPNIPICMSSYALQGLIV